MNITSTVISRDPHHGLVHRAVTGADARAAMRLSFAALREEIGRTGNLHAFAALSIPCRRGMLIIDISYRTTPVGIDVPRIRAKLNEYVDCGGRWHVPVCKRDFARALRAPDAF